MGKHNKSSFAFYLIQAQLEIYIMTSTHWSLIDFVDANSSHFPNDDIKLVAVMESVDQSLHIMK